MVSFDEKILQIAPSHIERLFCRPLPPRTFDFSKVSSMTKDETPKPLNFFRLPLSEFRFQKSPSPILDLPSSNQKRNMARTLADPRHVHPSAPYLAHAQAQQPLPAQGLQSHLQQSPACRAPAVRARASRNIFMFSSLFFKRTHYG